MKNLQTKQTKRKKTKDVEMTIEDEENEQGDK